MSKVCLVLAYMFFVLARGCFAEVPRQAVTDADEARLLKNNTLRIPVAGCITGSFKRASVMLQSSNLLESVQQAYAAQLPKGTKPEFEVKSAGEGVYYYVNKDNERCDIRELWRATDTNTWFRCAFYVSGERSFGLFESLIYMTVQRDEKASTDVLNYTTDVHVWPQGAVVRVILRFMPGVELYFRKKTADMKIIITNVFVSLVAAPLTLSMALPHDDLPLHGE